MEVKEEDSRICRLCGQSDNICIDVFSEDGTSRLLRFKIHSKINILIDERDLLPKAICVHCVGKLEFVCDFQEECLRTQELLRDRYNLPPLSDVDELEKLDQSVPGTSTINNNDSDKDLNRSRTSEFEEQEVPVELTKQPESLRCASATLSELQIPTEAPILTTLQNVSFPQEFANSQEILHNQVLEAPIIHETQEILNRDGLRTEVVVENHEPTLINGDDILNEVLQGRDVYQALPESPKTPIVTSIERTITEEAPSEPKPQNTCVRWLRGRNELEIKCPKKNSTQNKIRIRSKSPLRKSKGALAEKTNGQRNMIQIQTSTLNKLLNVIAETCEVEVSVRESLNTDNNAEDISFLIELRIKENSDVNVLAKVFPDQGSCLIDPTIIALLKDQGNSQISEIMKTIDSRSQKEIDNLEDEESQGQLRNPEELFRMDGEEIHVDENVEQVTVNNQVSYACRLCRKIYERRDKCTVHVKTHLGIKQYLCTVCQAKFVCKSDVMKHIRCSHTNPRPISCPKCPKRFRSKFDLAEHTNVHKGIKPYRCSDCDQTYHHKVSLQMHVKSHLPPQNLACEYCGKVFPYRTRLLSHVGSVHMKNRRNFRCHFCYNLYSSLSVLNDHIKTRHATTFTCETCNKTFKVASKYKAHVHQHTNPKPYVCTVCDNRYASKAFLNEHLLKHQGLRKHVCAKCGAKFAQASHLAAHRHVHGEKTHVCPECGKKFNRRDNMKVHRKRHFENDKKGKFIQKDDGLPTSVCVKCIGALEFLCDFYEWCHTTQKDLDSKILENSVDSDSLLSGNESDKENISPDNSTIRTLRSKSPDRNEDKENDPGSKEALILQLEGQVDLEAEVAIASENIVRVDVPVNGDKVPKTFGKELFVSLRKEVFPLGKNGFSVKNFERENSGVNGRSKEVASDEKNLEKKEKTSNLKGTVKEKEKKNKSKENVDKVKEKADKVKEKTDKVKEKKDKVKEKTDKIKEKTDKVKEKTDKVKEKADKVKEKVDKSKEKNIVTPLTQWLSGTSPMNKRKRNESPIRNEMVISRVSESKYSKVSELMTTAQKETIENYYRVDMSLVDEIKVADNMTIHSRNEIECKICKQKYSRMDKCQVHIWRHLEMKPYLCDACSFSTLTVSNIRCHIRKSHLKIKPYVCPLCEKQFTSPTCLEEHLNTHTGAKPYSCNECQFSSSSKQVLAYHKLTHKDQKDVECDVCGKTFYSKGRLRTHKFIHMKDTSFKCKFCSTYFMQKEALDKHYATSHVQDYECNICNKIYKSKKALNNHQNVHSEAKYQCTLCPNRYKSHHILKEHLLKHGGIRKYKCETCEKTFAQQSHLAAHMSVHIGIRYECPGCKKGFNRHDNMKVHTKRCSDFLRNPALKELLNTKVKVKTESVSSIETTIDNMSVSSKSSTNSRKNSTNKKKNFNSVELNVDLDNTAHESDSTYNYLDEENSRKESEILHSYGISDEEEEEEDDIISEGEIRVTENILSPECF